MKYHLHRLAVYTLIFFSKIEGSINDKKIKILYLSKPIFNNDVEALIKYTNQFTFIKFPRILLYPILDFFIPYSKKLNDSNYHLLTKNDPKINELREFWKMAIPLLKKKFRLDFILSGNFVYVTQQEMFVIAKQFNIKTVVLYKEGMFPYDRALEMNETLYKNKIFRSDLIFFYNEKIRDILINSSVPGILKSNSEVIGIPRLDETYFEYKKYNNTFSESIVLFAFSPEEKSSYLISDVSLKKKFELKLLNFQISLIEFCKKNYNFKLTIKIKSNPNELLFLKKLKKICDGFSDNISVTKDTTPINLIKKNSYIVGYSSTTLIEALIFNKTIISPKLTSFFISKSPDIFEKYNLSINYIDDFNELNKYVLLDMIKNNNLSEIEKEDFLNEKMFKFDGKSSFRFEKRILEFYNATKL